MATFTAGAGQAIDFDNFDVTDLVSGTPTATPTATTFRYETSGTEFREFTGTFTYLNNIWSGTITGILVVDPPGTTTYQITGASLPVANFLNFVNTNNPDGFLASIFGGSDTFTSAAGNHADNYDGFAGNDTIFAAGGDDTVNGGKGNDSLVGGDQDDILAGRRGRRHIGWRQRCHRRFHERRQRR